MLVNSYKSNPKGHIFAEPLGFVIFDNNQAKEVSKMNDPLFILNDNQFLDWCKKQGKKFYSFHGEHRRAAVEYLHGVIIPYFL